MTIGTIARVSAVKVLQRDASSTLSARLGRRKDEAVAARVTFVSVLVFKQRSLRTRSRKRGQVRVVLHGV